MSSLTIKQFNTIEYIKKLREADFTQAQAEAVAEVMEFQAQTIHDQQIEIDSLKSKEIATKSDIRESELRLQKEIESYKYDSLKFIVWVGIGIVATLSVMMARGFHWF